mgnify:CR=1 FL=1
MLRKAVLLFLVALCLSVAPVYAWSNGGFSQDPSSPKYGTHDWIAEHALDWLPPEAKRWITENLNWYLYGTELPDNGRAPDGIGDTELHHVYYSLNGTLVDDSAARRANETFHTAFSYMANGDFRRAAMWAGAMTHYIADVAVFGHVMGANTDWGAETHHKDFEDHVNSLTASYNSSLNAFLKFDGDLGPAPIAVNYRDVFPPGAGVISVYPRRPLDSAAYYTTLWVACDATFDLSGRNRTCKWLDSNYNWSNPSFVERVGELLSAAVNRVADALYSLYLKYELHKRGLEGTFDNIAILRVTTPAEDAADWVIEVNGTRFNSACLTVFCVNGSTLNYAFNRIVATASPDKRYRLLGHDEVYGYPLEKGGEASGAIRAVGYRHIDTNYLTEFKCTFTVEGLGSDASGVVLRLYAPDLHAEYSPADFPVRVWVSSEIGCIIRPAQKVDSTEPGKSYTLVGNYSEFLYPKKPETVVLSYTAVHGEVGSPWQRIQWPQIPLPKFEPYEVAFLVFGIVVAAILLATRGRARKASKLA